MHSRPPSVAKLFTLFPFYNRTPGPREGNNFAHSHTAGKWQNQGLNTSGLAPELKVSTPVLPVISLNSDASITQLYLSISRVQTWRPRKESNLRIVPQLKGTDF